jgi:hypothetical protein
MFHFDAREGGGGEGVATSLTCLRVFWSKMKALKNYYLFFTKRETLSSHTNGEPDHFHLKRVCETWVWVQRPP